MSNEPPTRERNDPGNVIRVAFGKGGGRIPSGVVSAESQRGTTATSVSPPPPQKLEEPVAAKFSRKDAARLVGLSEQRLVSLERAGIVEPAVADDGKKYYQFQDLISLRATGMLAKEVPIREVKRAIVELRSKLPFITRPLQELRLVSDGRRVVVRSDEGKYEATTGQMLLDFDLRTLREDVVKLLEPLRSKRSETAYDLYLRASTMDEDPSRFDEAEKLYERALVLDPRLAIAYTNLGNVKFRRGDLEEARKFYSRAVELDALQSEAHYNLGYLELDAKRPENAVRFFTVAVTRDPKFADAHFNLAVALAETGQTRRAREHWRRYLEIEPTGAWAETARGYLSNEPAPA